MHFFSIPHSLDNRTPLPCPPLGPCYNRRHLHADPRRGALGQGAATSCRGAAGRGEGPTGRQVRPISPGGRAQAGQDKGCHVPGATQCCRADLRLQGQEGQVSGTAVMAVAVWAGWGSTNGMRIGCMASQWEPLLYQSLVVLIRNKILQYSLYQVDVVVLSCHISALCLLSRFPRVIFGPELVMLGPDEQFTQLSLSGGKPKRPNVIKALCLLLGPDFCTDIITIETADHARLQLQLSYNW